MKRDYVIMFLSVVFSIISALFIMQTDAIAKISLNETNIALLEQSQDYNTTQHKETKILIKNLTKSNNKIVVKLERLANLIEGR